MIRTEEDFNYLGDADLDRIAAALSTITAEDFLFFSVQPSKRPTCAHVVIVLKAPLTGRRGWVQTDVPLEIPEPDVARLLTDLARARISNEETWLLRTETQSPPGASLITSGS